MASSAKISFLLFLLTLLSSHQILARESQFFNKIPRNTNNNDVVTEFEPVKQEQEEPLNYKPVQEEPNFLPENENNGYGLYGHESGQLPPSTTSAAAAGRPFKTTTTTNNFPNSKYLPKNYNTESYVTEPEGYTPTTTAAATTTTSAVVPENNNNNNNNNYNPFSTPNSKYLPKNYNTESYVTEPEGYNYNNNYQQQEQEEKRYSTKATGNNYGAGFSQNGYTTTGADSNNNNNYYNGGNSYEKQGMSDTRFLENGKYFHDINLEKSNFNVNPYENTRGFGNNQVNSYDLYNNNNNNAAMEGYQNNQFQNFQDEDDMP